MTDFESILKPILPQRIFAFIFQVLSIGLSLVQPLLIGLLLDAINNHLTSDSFQEITRLTVLLIVVSILDFIVYYLKDYLFSKALFNGVNLMRGHVLSLALSQPFSVLEKNNIGDKLNKILNDSEFYATYKIHQVPNAVIVLIRIISIYIILFNMNVELTGLIFVIFVIYLLIYLVINKKIQPLINRELAEYSNVMNKAQETVSGYDSIKMNVKEEYFENRFAQGLNKYLQSKVKVQRYSSLDSGLINLFYSLVPILILGAGAYLIVNGQITLGVLIAFYSYTHWIIEPVFALSKLNKIRQQAVVSFPRLKSFISEASVQDTEDDCGYTMDTIAPIETVTIENMNFSYSESKMIIKDLSLEMKIGDRIAITGESGTEKSTLAKLLLGVMQPDEGQILINETALDCIDVQSYLAHCSYLPQEIFMFSGSLEENIAFGEADLDLSEEIYEQLKLKDILSRNVQDVNELSGGERQRIGLARALHRNPSIVIFDEPTSSLDAEMEESIIQAMDDYLNQHPCIFIVITHGKPILKICDTELRIDRSARVEIVKN